MNTFVQITICILDKMIEHSCIGLIYINQFDDFVFINTLKGRNIYARKFEL